MADPARAQLLHFRREGKKRIELAVDEPLHRARFRLDDPAHIAYRIEADRRPKRHEKGRSARANRIAADALTLQIADVADRVPREQLEAAGVDAAQHGK